MWNSRGILALQPRNSSFGVRNDQRMLSNTALRFPCSSSSCHDFRKQAINFSKHLEEYLVLNREIEELLDQTEKLIHVIQRKMAFTLEQLASILGSDVAALRLVLSYFAGYPMALLYRLQLRRFPTEVQHGYFILCGALLFLFNYGLTMVHSLSCVLTLYISLHLLGPSRMFVAFNFLFQTGYLLTGYWLTESEKYDIIWTMPHCVLTLRLIGVAFDVHDGHKEESRRSREQREICLSQYPGLLELLAHSFFPTAFLVGPQFPLRHYQRFVTGELFQDGGDKTGNSEQTKDPPALEETVREAGGKFAIGIAYMLFFLIGSKFVPLEYVLGHDFKSLPFWRKLLMMAVWGKVLMGKYICSWLLTEGASILVGIGYIYKRLRFLGNKMLSQVGALCFLALWHGFHTGYYMVFLNELIVINAEKNLKDVLARNSRAVSVSRHALFRPFWFVFKRVWLWSGLSYACACFLLLCKEKWMRVYFELYCYWHLFYLPLFVGKSILRKVIPQDLREEDSFTNGNSKID